MTLELWIPGPLPNVNDIAGKNRWKYAKTKKEWTERIKLLARAAKLPPLKRAYFVFEWHELHRLRNPDNIAGGGKKLILDGLVKAGVLPNDGWGEIAGWSDSFVVDKARPGVLITITPVV